MDQQIAQISTDDAPLSDNLERPAERQHISKYSAWENLLVNKYFDEKLFQWFMQKSKNDDHI